MLGLHAHGAGCHARTGYNGGRVTDEYARWKAALSAERLPAAVVDLDAVDHNLAVLTAPLSGGSSTVRLATKSVRCVHLLRYLLDRGAGRLAGLMTYSVHESVMLADEGFDDLLGQPIPPSRLPSTSTHPGGRSGVCTSVFEGVRCATPHRSPAWAA
jgi:D-serine deaminase-like pyridoxal phosphate-dependent protein